MQKCGEIEKFDMLFHKSGTMVGQPRGYAFVTYKEIDGATKALTLLNGKMIGSKFISIRLAKNINYDDLDRPKPRIEIPVLAAGSSTETKKLTKAAKIQAIEAKLKSLETKSDDFEVNRTVTGQEPLIARYQFNKNQPTTRSQTTKYSGYKYNRHGPYKRRGRR